jgi:hypothetical protein
MYHTIEFVEELPVDLETSPKDWLQRMLKRRGTGFQAKIKPYVVKTDDGLVEVADLYFEDGATPRMVPFGSLMFID